MADETARKTRYTLEKTLTTPAHVASLTFGHGNHLFVGSDDGSVRVYDLSTYKVIKAIRGLETEVSSIVCVKRPGSELRDAWLAHGRHISKFQMSSDKMIQTLDDALSTIEVGKDDKEILNELSLNTDKSHLAFSLDSGHVGVVELSTGTITRLDKQHESICGSVRFVPDRPRELLSGGYDTHIFHLDVAQNKLLGDYCIAAVPADGTMSFAPPFILCMAFSSSGIVAAGTADGRLWIGFGGEKPSGGAKKKSKKWDGLNEQAAVMVKMAEGPIVSLAFTDSRILTLTTLLGTITQVNLLFDETTGASVTLQQLWEQSTQGLAKVNALVTDDKRIILGGFDANGKGVIEIWRQQIQEIPTLPTSQNTPVADG